jgi:hypothetical protein
MLKSKVCPKCESEKNIVDFSKNKSNVDGLQTYCKTCIKILNKSYTLSPEAKERKRVRNALWKKNNKLVTRDYDRTLLNGWRKSNPMKVSEHSLTRRASKINATPQWLTKEDRLQILNFCSLRKQLELQTGLKHHVDHIVPLQGENVCGLHVPWNLQVITAEENCSKNNKLIEELGIDLSALFYK